MLTLSDWFGSLHFFFLLCFDYFDISRMLLVLCTFLSNSKASTFKGKIKYSLKDFYFEGLSWLSHSGTCCPCKVESKTPSCVVWVKCHININAGSAIRTVTFPHIVLKKGSHEGTSFRFSAPLFTSLWFKSKSVNSPSSFKALHPDKLRDSFTILSAVLSNTLWPYLSLSLLLPPDLWLWIHKQEMKTLGSSIRKCHAQKHCRCAYLPMML